MEELMRKYYIIKNVEIINNLSDLYNNIVKEFLEQLQKFSIFPEERIRKISVLNLPKIDILKYLDIVSSVDDNIFKELSAKFYKKYEGLIVDITEQFYELNFILQQRKSTSVKIPEAEYIEYLIEYCHSQVGMYCYCLIYIYALLLSIPEEKSDKAISVEIERIEIFFDLAMKTFKS